MPRSPILAALLVAWLAVHAGAQGLGSADAPSPGDAPIRAWLAARTARVEAGLDEDLRRHEDDPSRRARLRAEYLHMLGLDPLPERVPLETTVTGSLAGEGYVVEMLHYRAAPGLVVTANLWRPSAAPPGTRHPAILYVCGHSGRGRDGNKTAFQDHGMWFARHGYVCLVVDTLQLGEIPGIHHGTYREGRFWWQSRGYTPAGVECWNGIRGLDLLAARDDVDAARLGVTGISGGGATTLWIAAADDRVAAAAPVSGMADLTGYVPGACIDGHCDCMFMVNAFAWPWTRIATLVAPRPLLFVNSDADPIFPMSANERVAAALERVYALHGAGDRFDAQVSVGGHAYRSDIRAGVYRFLNTWLKDDPRPVDDGDRDVVVEEGGRAVHPIPPERLRVFPTDADIPAGVTIGTIDATFVPLGNPGLPTADGFGRWRDQVLHALRRTTFREIAVDPAPPGVERGDGGAWRVESEPGMVVDVWPPPPAALPGARRHRLFVRGVDGEAPPRPEEGEATWVLDPRGVGRTRWTVRNPPRHVERSMALLGDTVAGGQVRDTLAAIAAIRAADGATPRPIGLVGRGGAGIVAADAAIFSPHVDAVTLETPPASHMHDGAPPLLGILRVADIPLLLGLLAPRRLEIEGVDPAPFADTAAIYAAAGAAGQVTIRAAAEPLPSLEQGR